MRYGEQTWCLVVFLLMGTASIAQDNSSPEEKAYRVGKIHLEKHTIFDEEEASTIFHRAANALHILTQDHVLRREFLFQSGDRYDPALLEETERNLRGLRFIAAAKIWAEFLEDQTVDIHVWVRDKFSLSVGAGGGITGGEGKLRFSLGESNLLGLGVAVKAHYIYREDDQGVDFYVNDPRFLGSRHNIRANIAVSKESKGYGIDLFRPFYSLDTLWSWGGSAGYRESPSLFYQAGEEVNRIPGESSETRIFLQRAWGDRERRFKIGPEISFEARGFSPPDPNDVVPGFELVTPTDRHITSISLRPTFEWFPEYIEREELDAIDFVEDIALGLAVQFGLGISYWDMKGGHGPRFPLDFSLVGTFEPWENHLGMFQGSATIRRGTADTETWQTYSAFHYYFTGFPSQTIAMSIAHDAGEDDLDLPVQYTLGENSGLRGYEARYFEGDRRLRINLEDRIFTPYEFFTLRLGFVLFFDAGYAWESREGFDPGDLKTSAGFGVRIGSARFFQGTVLRFDMAFPFDDEGSESFSISVTTGQVFSLFNNPDNLRFD